MSKQHWIPTRLYPSETQGDRKNMILVDDTGF